MLWIGVSRYKKEPAPAAVAQKGVENSPTAPIIRPCGVDKLGFDALVAVTAEMHLTRKRIEGRMSDIDAHLRDNGRSLERIEKELDEMRAQLPRRR